LATFTFPTLNISIMVLTINIDVNSETKIPIAKVKAKPRTGPSPDLNKINEVINEEMFESLMEFHARSNPSFTAKLRGFPQ